MPRIPIAEVVGAVTGTFHDGRNMIVLAEGKKATVAKSSLQYLRDRKLIRDNPLDHDEDGKAGGSKPRMTGVKPDKGGSLGGNSLTEARARYKTAFNKAPSPRWDEAEIDKRIADLATAPPEANGDNGALGDVGEDGGTAIDEALAAIASEGEDGGEDFAPGIVDLTSPGEDGGEASEDDAAPAA